MLVHAKQARQVLRAAPPPNAALVTVVALAVCVVTGHGGLRGRHKSSSAQVVPAAPTVPKRDASIRFLPRDGESQNNRPERWCRTVTPTQKKGLCQRSVVPLSWPAHHWQSENGGTQLPWTCEPGRRTAHPARQCHGPAQLAVVGLGKSAATGCWQSLAKH